jgi:hypothetical protein
MRNGRVTATDESEEMWDQTAVVWYYFVLCLEMSEEYELQQSK